MNKTQATSSCDCRGLWQQVRRNSNWKDNNSNSYNASLASSTRTQLI